MSPEMYWKTYAEGIGRRVEYRCRSRAPRIAGRQCFDQHVGCDYPIRDDESLTSLAGPRSKVQDRDRDHDRHACVARKTIVDTGDTEAESHTSDAEYRRDKNRQSPVAMIPAVCGDKQMG